MATPLRSLIWKEWHERRCALALGVAWILLGVAYAVLYEAMHRVHAPAASFENTCLLFGLCVAVFLAMRTALGEVTQGTLGFSARLPLALPRQAWMRVSGAVISLAAPMVLGALILCAVLLSGYIEQAPVRTGNYDKGFTLPERPPLSGLEACLVVWKVAGIAIASSVELLLLLSILGARRRAESHIGFLGAFLAFPWWILSFVGSSNPGVRSWLGVALPQSLVINYSYGSLDGSIYGDLSLADSIWPALAANLLVLIALAWWFTHRYGSGQRALAERWLVRFRLRPPAVLSRLPIRWPGRIAALVWLDLRQALPMSLAGLGLAILITAFMVSQDLRINSGLARAVAGRLGDITWFVAILWGAVVGSGMFASELGPKVEPFWRSRPISASAWYWVKFITGLVVVLSVLDLAPVLMSWNSPHDGANGQDAMSGSYVACMPLLHALTYGMAVLGVCWLRRPVAAAFAAVLVFFLATCTFELIPGAAQFDPVHVFDALYFDERIAPLVVKVGEDGPRQATFDLTQHGYPFVYGGVVVIIILAALAAWRGALRQSEL